jgi:hypothetical protein
MESAVNNPGGNCSGLLTIQDDPLVGPTFQLGESSLFDIRLLRLLLYHRSLPELPLDHRAMPDPGRQMPQAINPRCL